MQGPILEQLDADTGCLLVGPCHPCLAVHDVAILRCQHKAFHTWLYRAPENIWLSIVMLCCVVSTWALQSDPSMMTSLQHGDGDDYCRLVVC